MFAKLRLRLTYANVMATIAVFVALGGSSYAAIKVTGKDIKNSSLGTGDVKNGSLLAGDFKSGQIPAGPQGPTGQRGLPGPQGAKGDPCVPSDVACRGPRGAAGATNVVRRTGTTFTVGTNGGSGQALCQPGESATGGGAASNSTSAHIVSSTPSARPDSHFLTTDAWFVYVATSTGTTTVTPYVVCASP